MKKVIVMLLAIIMLVCLVASCNKTTDVKDDETTVAVADSGATVDSNAVNSGAVVDSGAVNSGATVDSGAVAQ